MRNLFAILFFALLAALLALTYYPDLPDLKVQIKDEWFRLDYIGHLGFYAAITATFLSWRAGWRMKTPRLLIILTLLGGFFLGIVTEISQQAISGRSYNPIDMAYNCAGIILGVLLIWSISNKVKQ